ncbi:MAG: rhomboid family intramembrane serine protease [Clostridia bacterium]|nr:rhomboid family intramembrane serine protease [Clostridia bacterium]
MKWLNAIERKIGRHYIPNLMKYLVLAMAGVFILEYLPLPRSAYQFLMFDRAAVLRGEIWRVITFIFLPPNASLFWIIFSLYFYYFLGSSLESQWGSARFNIYYLFGIIGNVIAGFITGYATNEYLNLSLLLGFAALFPNMEFMLFFFLPVKVKWIGLVDGLFLIYQLIMVPWPNKIALVASMLPFILFFGRDAWLMIRMEYRRIRRWFAMRR